MEKIWPDHRFPEWYNFCNNKGGGAEWEVKFHAKREGKERPPV